MAKKTASAPAKPVVSATKPRSAVGRPKSPVTRAPKPVLLGGMESSRLEHAIAAFKLASDPTRFRIMCLLSDRECNVGEICELMNQAQPAISHHLALLRVSGQIMPRREGKHNFYALTAQGRKLVDAARSITEPTRD